MPLPSFYVSSEATHAWSVLRAARYGALIGGLAAVFKTLAPLHTVSTLGGSTAASFVANVPEIVAATIAFSLLCAAAAALRNLISEHLIWPEGK